MDDPSKATSDAAHPGETAEVDDLVRLRPVGPFRVLDANRAALVRYLREDMAKR